MKNVMIALALCLIACTSLSAQPQGQRGPRGVNLDEIPGITADQKEKIGKIQAAQREEMQKMFGQNRESRRQMTQEQREEMRNKMNEAREKAMKEIESVLTPDQFKVYKEKTEAQQQQMRQGNRGDRRPQAHQGHGPRSGRQVAMRRAPRMERKMHRPAPQVTCPCMEPPKTESNS